MAQVMVQVAEQGGGAALLEPAPLGEAERRAVRRPRRERRTAKKLVSYTPAELAAVCAHARRCGMTPARFIREVSLGAAVRPRRTERADEVIRQLARIGSTLTALQQELAPRAVAHDSRARAEIDAALSALTAALDRIG